MLPHIVQIGQLLFFYLLGKKKDFLPPESNSLKKLLKCKIATFLKFRGIHEQQHLSFQQLSRFIKDANAPKGHK